MCLRDEFDMPMEDKNIWLQPIMSADIREALGLLEAMQMGKRVRV